MREAFPALLGIPIGAEASLVILAETLLLHRRWLEAQFKKVDRKNSIKV